MLSYFADDVALKLDSCHVFYTPNVGIRGVSSYEHNFDFLFQRSANHPARFCQAPNRFDKDAVKDIMFGWDDTKKDPKRRDSRLIVIGDDRQTPLQRGALTAFRNYGVLYPLLQIGRAGSRGTRRVASEPYKDSSRRLTASTGMSPWFLCFAI